jgi:hypothetical protein
MKIQARIAALFFISVGLFSGITPCAYGASIVADHSVVDQYDAIPAYWIQEVKKMWLNVPGESHSSGYRIGLQLLAQQNSLFAASITESGAPEAYRTDALRASRASWGDVSDSTSWRYGYGEEDFWTSQLAVDRTKAHLTYANTHNLAIAAFGFGWCWDMTWHNDPGGGVDPVYKVRWAGSSVGGASGDLRWGLDDGDTALTGNTLNMDDYLAAVEAYRSHCAANGYPTKVFFTTGPVDGGGNTGESGYQRHVKHEHIRQYVQADGTRILFDYADILCYSDGGAVNELSWTDAGGGVHRFPYIHPDNMKDLNGGYTEDGDHIGEVGTVRLAKALWWMLARMAGWEGQSGTTTTTVSVNPTTSIPGTTTTTTAIHLCPAEQLLGPESRQELNALRAFRDKRLARTPGGRMLVLLYYVHSAEIRDILATNQDIQADAHALLVELLPLIQGQEGASPLTPEHLERACLLLQSIRKHASPSLDKTIFMLLYSMKAECF